MPRRNQDDDYAEKAVEGAVEKVLGPIGKPCGLSGFRVLSLLVVFLVVGALGYIVMGAFADVLGPLEHLSVSDTEKMRDVWKSGSPWLILCRDASKGPFERTLMGLREVASALDGSDGQEAVRVGTLDCGTTLPSGKTTFDRLGWSSDGHLVAFTIANGRGPRRVPQGLLSSLASSATSKKQTTAKSNKPWESNSVATDGYSRAVQSVVTHVREEVGVKVTPLTKGSLLRSCVRDANGLDRKGCVLLASSGKMTGPLRQHVLNLRSELRKPTILALDVSKREISGLSGPILGMMNAARRKKNSLAVFLFHTPSVHSLFLSKVDNTSQLIQALHFLDTQPQPNPDILPGEGSPTDVLAGPVDIQRLKLSSTTAPKTPSQKRDRKPNHQPTPTPTPTPNHREQRRRLDEQTQEHIATEVDQDEYYEDDDEFEEEEEEVVELDEL